MKNPYYLISSLPALKFGAPLPISMEKFLLSCSAFLDKDEMRELNELSLLPSDTRGKMNNKVIELWYDWETSLRNRLAKLRAKSKAINYVPYQEKKFYADSEKSASTAIFAKSPLEKERLLYYQRWKKLEELASENHFNFNALIIYKLKLELLEKLNSLDKERGRNNIKQIKENIVKNG